MPSSARVQLAVGIVLLCAAVLRLVALDLTAFNIDEARLCMAAGSAVRGEVFPWHGIRTSFGFHNPPLFVWLAMVPFAASDDPLVAMALLALLGTVASALAGDAVRRALGPVAGAATLALVAFSPAAIDHCRRLWGHDTIVFWSALALWTAVRGVERNRWPWLAASAAAAAGAQACHLSGALVWIVPLGALAAFRVPGWWKAALAGGLVLAAVYAPWLLEDAGLVGDPRPERFVQLRMIVATATGQAEGAGTPGFSSAPVAWLAVLADLRDDDNVGREYAALHRAGAPLGAALLAATALLAAAQIAGIGSAAARAWKERSAMSAETRWRLVLAVAALAPLAVFGLLPVATVPPYQLPALVPCAALAGTAAAMLWRGRPRFAVAGAGGLLAAFAIWHTLAIRSHLAGIGFDSDVGGLLRWKRLAVEYVAAQAGRDEYTIMQDGRAPEAGVDWWVLYMHYLATGKREAPTAPTDRVFVLRDARTVLRPEPLAVLESTPHIDVGMFRIHEFRGQQEAERWRRTVAEHPPERNP